MTFSSQGDIFDLRRSYELQVQSLPFHDDSPTSSDPAAEIGRTVELVERNLSRERAAEISKFV
jgi:hypothetical protein